ncbi:hypothetical protein [Microbacterium sp. YY-01]|uniref:hypothetical protein n=1 Tax=Microbacterium sp. YY-01 TaxID=3421634 RepID=UPI003D16F0BB
MSDQQQPPYPPPAPVPPAPHSAVPPAPHGAPSSAASGGGYAPPPAPAPYGQQAQQQPPQPFGQPQPAPPQSQPQSPPQPYGQQPTQPYGQPPYAPPSGPTPPTFGQTGSPYPGASLPQQVPAAPARKSKVTGVIAFVMGVVAGVIAPILAFSPSYKIGQALMSPGATQYLENDDLTPLIPVRGDVLFVELLFWGGTLLGIAAIVMGIIAIAKKKGRGFGIFAIILALLGAVAFWLIVVLAMGTSAVDIVTS